MNLYPFKFEPILRQMIWGGNDICPFKGLPQENGIGESWEISHVEGMVSIVSNGVLVGTSLEEVINEYGASLLGKKVQELTGNVFPLLIKFIDARDDLSIQVHPDDELARQRHNSFGKTEMWYVIKAQPEAFLYSGFNKQISPEIYKQSVADNTFTDTLQRYDVHAGDVFFLPAGRVHAIGSGCFIAEIQQTSDITYRIYDYNRKDAQGNTRELHTELAKDAIDYQVYPEGYKTNYQPQKNTAAPLASCRYFTTNLLEGDQKIVRNLSDIDSFVVYICMEGKLSLSDANGYAIDLKQGETALVPAACKGNITIIPSEKYRLLETYVGE